MTTCSIPAPLTIVRDGAVTDADALAQLHRSADSLVAAMRGEVDAAELTAATLTALGIDPSDRLA